MIPRARFLIVRKRSYKYGKRENENPGLLNSNDKY